MEDYLSQITNPEDIRSLSVEQLYGLAQNLRERIIDVTAEHGGHLSSSLGVVELTLALHYVFQTPTDKLIWDVGHQSYAHKLITGRRDRFHTLRQFEGISGFPKPAESEYDAFVTGHSSTSISAALGMAVARDLQGGDEKIVAVIGDGALSGGMAFEALNNAGQSGKNLMVVLNANDMSISPSVGAISKYLNSIITNPLFDRLKSDLEEMVERIPRIGHFFVETAHKMEEGFKSILVPGVIFEEMGFRYFGPFDGHDIGHMIRILKSLKNFKGPIIVHVNTKKGKGYLPAEKHPDLFHSAAPFDKETGEVIKKKGEKSHTEVFSRVITELGEKNDNIIAITAAMMHGTGLDVFAERFPERFFDVGIAEQHAVTFAGGAAARGLKPVVAIYSTFIQRAVDQILHDICIEKLPVVFAIDRAGLVGADGPTHHGLFDISLLRTIPNLVLMQPASEKEMETMFEDAFSYDGPVGIRYPRGAVAYTEKEDYCPCGIGKGRIMRDGEDMVIIALGNMLAAGLEIAEKLEENHLSVCVIDPRSIKPLDEKLLEETFSRIKKCVVLEDHVVTGGFGSAVMEFANERSLRGIDFLLFGYPDSFIEHGAKDILMDKYGLSPEKICENIKKQLF